MGSPLHNTYRRYRTYEYVPLETNPLVALGWLIKLPFSIYINFNGGFLQVHFEGAIVLNDCNHSEAGVVANAPVHNHY